MFLGIISGTTGAATDPETRLIYIPNAFNAEMMRLNLDTETHDRLPIPLELKHTLAYRLLGCMESSFAETTLLRRTGDSMCVHDADGWRNISTEIKAQAHSGSRIGLFRGSISDIYVLDALIMTWIKGSDVAANDRRIQGGLGEDGFTIKPTVGQTPTSLHSAPPVPTTLPTTTTQRSATLSPITKIPSSPTVRENL